MSKHIQSGEIWLSNSDGLIMRVDDTFIWLTNPPRISELPTSHFTEGSAKKFIVKPDWEKVRQSLMEDLE